MANNQILIIAFLGDPTIPPGIPYAGGFNQTLKELLVYLATLSFQFMVMTDRYSNDLATHQRIASNIELYRMNISKDERLHQDHLFHATTRILNDMKIIMEHNDFHPCLVHSFYWFSGHIAQELNRTQGIPFMHTIVSLSKYKTVMGEPANSVYQLACEKEFLSKARCILAITPTESLFLQQYYCVDKDKIVIIGRSIEDYFHEPSHDENGLPYAAITPLRANSDFFLQNANWWLGGAFLYIGRIVSIKGVNYIVAAWSALYAKYKERTPPLWIVGGTPDMISSMRNTIKSSGLNLEESEKTHKLVWWGYLNSASISTLLLKALSLVTHSKFEPGGRVLIEAMCQGKPTIATPNGFAKDYIQNWQNGFLVEYGDVDRLARTMEYFLFSPLLSHTMGKSAKRRFQQLETEWNFFETHKHLYASLGKPYETVVEGCDKGLNIETLENYPGEITVYPYWDTQSDINELVKKVAKQFKSNDGELEVQQVPSQNARCYIIHSKEQPLVLKQFFNRINPNALWNALDTNKAFFALDLMNYAKESATFRPVLPIEFAMDEFVCVCMKKSSSPDKPLTIKEIEAILYLFSEPQKNITRLPEKSNLCVPPDTESLEAAYALHQKHWECGRFESFTLDLGISTLVYHSRKNSIWPGMITDDNLGKLFYMLDLSGEEARYGMNYGKAISSHIVLGGQQYLLLPTDSWYKGEIGLDIITELIRRKEGERLCSAPISLLSIGHLRLLIWQLYYLWREMYLASWLDLESDKYHLHLLASTWRAAQQYL